MQGYIAQFNIKTSAGGMLPIRFIFAPDFTALVDELIVYHHLTLGWAKADSMYDKYARLPLVKGGEIELGERLLVTLFRAGRHGDLSDFVIDEHMLGRMNETFDSEYIHLLRDVLADLAPTEDAN